jgi:hypothetical protein
MTRAAWVIAALLALILFEVRTARVGMSPLQEVAAGVRSTVAGFGTQEEAMPGGGGGILNLHADEAAAAAQLEAQLARPPSAPAR